MSDHANIPSSDDSSLTPRKPDLSEIIAAARARTQARILTGRAGSSYRTATQLSLRHDHAAARDAVWAEIDLGRDIGPELVTRFGLFEVCTRATSKQEYLLRPDLGRRLSETGRQSVSANCPAGAALQIVIGDGLSAAAVVTQVPRLLRLLIEHAHAGGWEVGKPFLVRYCRVGVLNDVGDILDPEVVVLLIGERPGLATAESLSAYLAYRPRPGHTDAQRNLISNIYQRGVSIEEAVPRILALAAQLRGLKTSGVSVKEQTCPGDGLPRLG